MLQESLCHKHTPDGEECDCAAFFVHVSTPVRAIPMLLLKVLRLTTTSGVDMHLTLQTCVPKR